MLSWGNKNITVEIPISGGGGSGTNKPVDINPAENNTEYVLSGVTFRGQPIYYQWYNTRIRVSTSSATLIDGVNVFLHQGLTVQGVSNGSPKGVKWLLPYVHTNNVGVIIQLNGTALQVQSQSSDFAGTYQIAGLLIYTKAS